jgi:hypothetical protein
VSALLIAAVGLGSWQLADALLKGDKPTEQNQPAPPPVQQSAPAEPQPLAVAGVTEFDPQGTGGGQNPEEAPNAVDGDPDTSWHTKNYYGPSFGNLKDGLGLVLDLGEVQEVSTLTVDAVGDTTVEFRAAPADAAGMPTQINDYVTVAEGSGESLTLQAEEAVETRYVLVWLTDLPVGDDGNYRGRITDVVVSG